MERKISAAAFEARCLALIDEVAEGGQPITVTKRGKAKVQIIPVREKPKTLLGATKGTFKILGDIVSPLDKEYEEVAESGTSIAGFKLGKAKVQIVPVREKPKTLWGATKGTFKIHGDILGPLDEPYDEDREWRNITGQFDDPPARYAHDPVDDGAGAKARNPRKAQLRGRTRRR